MGKWKVSKCASCSDCGVWLAVSPLGYSTSWPSWRRAMLRATKGY